MSPHIVFIFLGESVPKYVIANISRTRALFPGAHIVVAGQSEKLKKIADTVGGTFFSLSRRFGDPSLVPTDIKQSELDLSFWSGYWQKTFDRLLALSDIHDFVGDGCLIHVESDVILTRDFPLESFTGNKYLMWAGFHERADIASIVSSPSAKSSRWLANALVSEARLDGAITDMSALRRVRAKYPDKIRLLPGSPLETHKSPFQEIVFDGAHFGEWIFGWDPKAHWGFKRRRKWINPYSDSVSKGNFEMDQDSIVFTLQGRSARLANIHVHSKEVAFFAPDISLKMRRLLRKIRHRSLFYGFVPSAFASWTVSRFKRWSATILTMIFSKISK